MRAIAKFKISMILIGAALFAGCVQFKPVPGYGRPGDVIILGLGGVVRNSGGTYHANQIKEDLSVTISQNGTTYDLQQGHIFKAYPDYASALSLVSTSTAVGDMADPFDGGWFLQAALRYPNDMTVAEELRDTPLPLLPGQATISIESPLLINTGAGTNDEGDFTNITMEILAGETAELDQNYTMQFEVYADLEQYLVIRPADLTGIDSVGAAQFAVNFPTDALYNQAKPFAVPVGHHPRLQITSNEIDNGDGTSTLIILMSNSNGFHKRENRSYEQSLLADLEIKILFWLGTQLNANFLQKSDLVDNFSLDTANSFYLDMDGNEIPNLVPEMLHVDDL